MNIIGPDELVFGVDDITGCSQYLSDYGLTPVGADASGGRFEAEDGTAVVIRRNDDPSLPAGLGTASMLRKTTYGVADAATLEAIASELGRDREVLLLADGSLQTVDDMGFVLYLGDTATASGNQAQAEAEFLSKYAKLTFLGSGPEAAPEAV